MDFAGAACCQRTYGVASNVTYFQTVSFFKPHGSQEKRAAVAKPVETSFMLWIPPALLALGSIALPVLALGWLNSNIVAPGVQTVSPDLLVGDVKLWQGINLPLILSGLTLGLGVLFYKLSGRAQTWWDRGA